MIRYSENLVLDMYILLFVKHYLAVLFSNAAVDNFS